MSEATKTLVFAGAALLSVGLAIFSRPTTEDYDVNRQLGAPIAAAFEPEDAKRLTVSQFDEETFDRETFEVAEKDGVWTLPSKGGYPADAERQLAEAITGVSDREILDVVSEQASQHAEYGVLDPDASDIEPGQTGVGSRVSLADADGKKLVDLIIGKEVKEAEGKHYVRRAGQDVVYVVEIDPSSFSTDFSEWIEDDLLKLNSWDISEVRIRDYSSELMITLQGAMIDNTYRSDITLAYDDGESKWSLEKLLLPTDAKRGEFEPAELGGDQELNEDKLTGLKDALDDLKIVDVASKPEGLSADLKAGEGFEQDDDSRVSLARKGFVIAGKRGGGSELFASEGEVVCTMRDGVEYVLRFGNLELSDNGPAEETADGEGEASGEGVNRYLFVMARLNEDAIERPELEEVPPLPNDAADEGEGASEGEGANDEADDETDGDSTDGDSEESGADESGEDADDEASDEASDDGPTELEQAVAARKAVEERNAQLLDEYEDKLAAARKRVDELNDRFGDWYYVVSNEVFNKIRLGKDDVIKAKEKSDEDIKGDETGDEAEDKPADASAFGAPGSAVPGLPGLESAIESDADEEPAKESADETASEAESEADLDAEDTSAEE